VQVGSLTGVQSIGVGVEHSCAVLGDGTVDCWGSDTAGQLGPTNPGVGTPVTVAGVGGAISVAAGNAFTCAVLATGAVMCWGDNEFGELGAGLTANSSATPVQVTGFSDAIKVVAGDRFACALRAGGTVACWGDNSVHQSGSAGTAPSATPQPILSGFNFLGTNLPLGQLGSVADIVAGNDHACAVTTSRHLVCWGNNGSGQLGIASTVPSSPFAQVVEVESGGTILGNLSGVTTVAASSTTTCATLLEGEIGNSILCWGDDVLGEFGNGTTSATPSNAVTEQSPLELRSIVSLSGNETNFCALLTSGGIECWGFNLGGLGDAGGTINSSSPILVQF
jgi:alpha-tubulin suppressor-like RCC1 family protein